MKTNSLSNAQVGVLTILRMGIGWYLLFQGISKYYNPAWSSKGYLNSSDWILAGFFQWVAGSSAMLSFVDFLNVYGQLAIGIGLILGLFSRVAAISGVLMFGLYYLAHPPFIGLSGLEDSVGVNNLFILILGLLVTWYFPSSHLIGLDRLLIKTTKDKEVVTT